jgi:hypothetical protein
MGLGANFGTSSSNREKEYFVVPQNRQRTPNADPGGWKIVKGYREQGANTVETATSKRQAQSRAKELAKKNNMKLTVFDAAKKSSRFFDYS